MPLEYSKDERSKAKRYAKRVTYDKKIIQGIVDAAQILHVSFNAPSSNEEASMPQFPTILPMLGAMGTYPAATKDNDDDDDDEEEAVIYLHGSSAARLFRLDTQEPGLLPVCVAATILDGYVLALTPFNHSCNYRSAILFGVASKVQDPDELLFAMELITDHMVTDRWSNSRTPPTKAEMTATGVLKVKVQTASCKVRNGGPHDDRKDLKDKGVTARVWTGTVPVYQVLGDPVANPENKVKNVPDNVQKWVKNTNLQSKDSAIKSMEE